MQDVANQVRTLVSMLAGSGTITPEVRHLISSILCPGPGVGALQERYTSLVRSPGTDDLLRHRLRLALTALGRMYRAPAATAGQVADLVALADAMDARPVVPAQGRTQAELAAELSCDSNTVRRWASALDLPPRARGESYTASEVRLILEVASRKSSKAGRRARELLANTN